MTVQYVPPGSDGRVNAVEYFGIPTGGVADASTQLSAALNSGLPLYFPPGDIRIVSGITIGNVNVNVISDARFFTPKTSGITYAPTWGNEQTLNAIVEGAQCTNANGFAPAAGGTNYAVGDILEVPANTCQAKTTRQRTRFQVATLSGSAVATLNVIDAGVMVQVPANNVTLVSITGTGSGCQVALTWTTPPSIQQKACTQLGIVNTGGSVSADGTTITLDDGTTLAIGDKIKIMSNQVCAWNYSNNMAAVAAVNSSVNGIGPRITAGGSGYAVNDTITLGKLTAGFTVGADGIPVQTGETATILTVDAVTAAGAVTACHVSTAGSYAAITYEPVTQGSTSGGGTGFKCQLTWTTTTAAGFGELCAIAKIVDKNTVLLDRLLKLPHIYDAGNAPVIRKLPTKTFYWTGGRFKGDPAVGNIHDTAITGRTPATITIQGAVNPVFKDVTSEGTFERFVEENSVWHGSYSLTVLDGIDMPTQGGYGYGWATFGGCGSRVQVTSYGCRHVVTGGCYQYQFNNHATQYRKIGGSFDIVVHDSVSHGAHGGASFDTHEDCYMWTFDNCVAYDNTPDPVSGTTSIGFVIRGFANVIQNCRAVNCVVGFDDRSQTFPFSGIFGPQSMTRFNGCTSENNDRIGGSGAAAIGFNVSGPAILTSKWGQTDRYGVTVFKNCTAIRAGKFCAVAENINKVVIEQCSGYDLDAIVAFTGPVTVVVNGFFMDLSTALKKSTTARMIVRNLASNVTGNCVVVATNVCTWGTSGNTLTILSNLDTTAGNGVTFYKGLIQQPGGVAHTAYSTSGGTVSLVNMLSEAFMGRQQVLGSYQGVNLNSATTDHAIPMPAGVKQYMVTDCILTNVTVSLTSATGGLFTSTGGGGTALAANQALSALTGTATQALKMTMAAAAGNTRLTAGTLQWRTGTAQGVAATGDVYVLGIDLSIT